MTLADQDPYGRRRATLTDSGTARYESLCRQRQIALQVPAPRFGATCQRAGADDPNPPGGTTLPD